MTGDFCAAVVSSGAVPTIGKRPYIADHKLYFADFKKPEPAYYLCGLLHSEIVKEMIEAHNVATNMGDIFKHVSLPPYSASDSKHAKLVELVKTAHGQHDEKARAKTVGQVRTLAAEIIVAEIAARGGNAAAVS